MPALDILAGPNVTVGPVAAAAPTTEEIECLDSELFHRYRACTKVESDLNRRIVSFQANKLRPAYRWYKYKESFSASLVEYLLSRYEIFQGRILDPFAGAGTAMFAASANGLEADGIELLPIGQQIIKTRQLLINGLAKEDVAALHTWAKEHPWQHSAITGNLPALRITEGAYSPETSTAIVQYLSAIEAESTPIKTILRFALLCVLESISFTRKDGQYLRWDARATQRKSKKPFHKGSIPSFHKAISEKLHEIISDVNIGDGNAGLFPASASKGRIQLLEGSCLQLLPSLEAETYDAILTSPPYCNRYDYTRTYALELALLGICEHELSDLRQNMLSCTVENRAKNLLALNKSWERAVVAADKQELLQSILRHLERLKEEGTLNNSGIPRMVRGYFYEMSCVIFECARVLKRGGKLLMVNDNVKYAGISVSVDLILTDIAEQLGFRVDQILVLPNGKGNSSQQMGEHGREVLRKCVYVWSKA